MEKFLCFFFLSPMDDDNGDGLVRESGEEEKHLFPLEGVRIKAKYRNFPIYFLLNN